jgi:hypothetical protein
MIEGGQTPNVVLEETNMQIPPMPHNVTARYEAWQVSQCERIAFGRWRRSGGGAGRGTVAFGPFSTKVVSLSCFDAQLPVFVATVLVQVVMADTLFQAIGHVFPMQITR